MAKSVVDVIVGCWWYCIERLDGNSVVEVHQTKFRQKKSRCLSHNVVVPVFTAVIIYLAVVPLVTCGHHRYQVLVAVAVVASASMFLAVR
jgi:uncharacterized protein involved in cysteine biosynthesis